MDETSFTRLLGENPAISMDLESFKKRECVGAAVADAGADAVLVVVVLC